MNSGFLSGWFEEIIPGSSNSILQDICGRTLAGVMGIKLEVEEMAKLGGVMFVE